MFTQFVNYIQKNVGTTAVTLVTCPANNQLAVNQLSCANVTSFPVTCSVTVTRSGVAIFVLRNATVPPGGSLICVGESQKIVLMAGDVLQVQSSTATSIDCVVSGVLNDFNRAATVPAVVSGSNATISVFPNTTTIGEGGSVSFGVTTNLPNGTVIYWENIGTTNAQDFTDDLNSGAVVISGGQASISRTLRSTLTGVDIVGEGNETIVMIVGTTPRYLGGGALAVSSTVTVLDTPVTLGLVLHLDASNPASYPGSGTTWFDLSGGSNNGTLINGPTYNSDNGGSIVFDGTDDRVSSSNSIVVGNSPRTLEVWCRGTGADRVPLSLTTAASGTANAAFAVSAVSSSLVNIYGGTNPFDESSIPVSINFIDGNWHQMLVTWDGNNPGTLLIYGDGVQVGTRTRSTGSAYNTTAGYIVGTWYDFNRFYSGNIANCKIYNRALSAAEVAQNFNALRGRFGI
jgi:hypothetical protein